MRGYEKQSALLLETLRIAATKEVFALKGGTAINFFFHDCPRFSVDIDLCYLPVSERDQAFRDIREKMEAIKAEMKLLKESNSISFVLCLKFKW
ncbi:MAG: nucleotidyl transferase AbiEii/AbiGii toxin family protein [Candidatus Dadabacteria bacterium]|nr:nucleotidyl transferase AbiEii/AbiGii toxin family protein [Candidatus Dadabacteria bacterium]